MKLLIVLIVFTFVACNPKNLQVNGKYIAEIKQNTIKFEDGSTYELNHEEGAKTFYLVRHAEKDTIPKKNPYLTEEGTERSYKLASIFKQSRIDAVYSTLYNRTMHTVDSLVQMKGISTEIYQPGDLKGLSDKLMADTQNNNVLIAGHSNTTPALAGVIIGEKQFEKGFDESDYDNILVVNVDKEGKMTLLKLKYK